MQHSTTGVAAWLHRAGWQAPAAIAVVMVRARRPWRPASGGPPRPWLPGDARHPGNIRTGRAPGSRPVPPGPARAGGPPGTGSPPAPRGHRFPAGQRPDTCRTGRAAPQAGALGDAGWPAGPGPCAGTPSHPSVTDPCRRSNRSVSDSTQMLMPPVGIDGEGADPAPALIDTAARRRLSGQPPGVAARLSQLRCARFIQQIQLHHRLGLQPHRQRLGACHPGAGSSAQSNLNGRSRSAANRCMSRISCWLRVSATVLSARGRRRSSSRSMPRRQRSNEPAHPGDRFVGLRGCDRKG